MEWGSEDKDKDVTGTEEIECAVAALESAAVVVGAQALEREEVGNEAEGRMMMMRVSEDGHQD